MKLDLVKRTFNYAVVNKPSGMVCDASHTNNIITALTNEFTKILPSVNSSQFRLVQRLDRFVTGGLVVARNKNGQIKLENRFSGRYTSTYKKVCRINCSRPNS